jgi:hypothetical protein
MRSEQWDIGFKLIKCCLPGNHLNELLSQPRGDRKYIQDTGTSSGVPCSVVLGPSHIRPLSSSGSGGGGPLQ